MLEQHFFAGEGGDIDGLAAALEERGFKVESLVYDPESRRPGLAAGRGSAQLLEERRLLAVSDELDGCRPGRTT